MPTMMMAMNAPSIEKFLNSIESLIPATKHNLEANPMMPIISPATSAIMMGACMLPGPVVERNSIEGAISSTASKLMAAIGSMKPSVFEMLYVRFSV